jgi:hypothetical protein
MDQTTLPHRCVLSLVRLFVNAAATDPMHALTQRIEKIPQEFFRDLFVFNCRRQANALIGSD